MKLTLRIGSTLLLVLAALPGLAQTNLKITAPTPNVSGSENVTLGVGAGQKTTGSNNVFTGFQAGASNASGNFNSFFAHSAGQSNPFGSRNTFAGDGAGFANISGSDNIFIGGNAGQHNTSGAQNVFVGQLAGFSNTFRYRRGGADVPDCHPWPGRTHPEPRYAAGRYVPVPALDRRPDR